MGYASVKSYKLAVLEDIYNTPSIVKAIDSKSSDFVPSSPDTLLYVNIFPYRKVPDVQTESETYILLSIDIANINKKSKSLADAFFKILVLSHENCMKMEDEAATRIDYISEEIVTLLEGSTKYGCGQLNLVSNVEIILAGNNSYHGRELIFKVFDFKVDMCS